MFPRRDLETIFLAGVAACHPSRVVPPHLPEPPPGRTLLLALGKGAVAMAEAVEKRWDAPLSGLAVSPHGSAATLSRIACMTAGHPVPDAASVEAAERLLKLAADAGPDDLVLLLLSGGASSLACLPGPGLSLEEKQGITKALLRSGASIAEINCVRRHLSRFKGGRLAQAAMPARIATIAISDVVGDSPQDIGSGPTAPDPAACEDARAILRHYRIAEPQVGWSESVKPDAALAWRSEYRIAARGRDAVDAAALLAERLGYAPRIIDYESIGEARDVGRAHAHLALEARRQGSKTALISGGELTVTISGNGSGGPNREYALALAQALAGAEGIYALAGDTDGIDGAGEAAGAFIGPDTLKRARGLGLDAAQALQNNDSGTFFAALGDRFVTGPTGTNVNDLRIILIAP